jgi:hypothetical protein
MAVSVLAGGVGWGGWSQVHSHVYDYPSNLAVSSCSRDE